MKKRWKLFAFTMLLVLSLVNSIPAHAQAVVINGRALEQKVLGGDKVDFLYKASNAYRWAGMAADAVTTVQCINHPTMAEGADGTFLMSYHGSEAGWAKFAGSRNAGAAVALNVAMNAGVSFLSHRLYERGGKWRWLAIGMNLYKGTDSFMAARHNMGIPASVNRYVRAETGYQGQITWSH